jgi:uncharacterized protein (DUF2336 family)
MVVERFMTWLASAPAQARADAADAMTRAWLVPDLADEQRDALDHLLIVLLDDPSPHVRAALARGLGPQAGAPRPVILGLTQDQPDIAAIVARTSPLLLDAELIDLAAVSTVVVQVAIAERPLVSAGLSAAIVEVAEPAACLALLHNSGARITASSIARLADRLGHEALIREALLAMPDLPSDLRQLLIAKLAERLQGFVVDRQWLHAERAYAVTREACDKATVAISVETTVAETRRLVLHLRNTGQLTVPLLLRAVCAGNVRFFEEALALLSGLKPDRVYALLADGRATSLQALCERAGLPGRVIPVFRIALDTHRDLALDGLAGDGARFSRRMIERVLTRTSDGLASDVEDLLVLLRRFATEAARDQVRAHSAQAA